MKHDRSGARMSVWLLTCVFVASVGHSQAQSSEPEAAKKQLPADIRAFNAARDIKDPEQCLAALQAFVRDYPKSHAREDADEVMFILLLKNFPERTSEIDPYVMAVVKHSPKGFPRLSEESYVAFELLEKGSMAVDLPRAKKLAKDAVSHLTEAAYTRDTLATYAKFKYPAPKPADMHRHFVNIQADALAILADVLLREGNQDQAARLISEAYSLDPLVDDVNIQRGRLALLRHDDALALSSLERAQVVGVTSPADREMLAQLYRRAHAGVETGLNAELDGLYAELFPPPFVPDKPSLVAGGHTVLLELFTGSGCGPCVGVDVAVDGMLEAYPRSEVVALAFDQHIPEPDPLANPDSVARGELYNIPGTPTVAIDGVTLPPMGGDREEGQKFYKDFAKTIDAEAVRPTGVELKLSVNAAAGGMIGAKAIVTLPGGDDLARTLLAKSQPEPEAKNEPGAKKAPAVTTNPAATAKLVAPPTPKLVVNFALVEDAVRYSGENGVRFHRMVVRSLAKPAESGYPVEPASTVTLDASFDPAAISHSLSSYLDTYEQDRVRFGRKFSSKDTAIWPEHLAVAAWVQDTVTHRVLQTAILPVGKGEEQHEASASLSTRGFDGHN